MSLPKVYGSCTGFGVWTVVVEVQAYSADAAIREAIKALEDEQ